MSEHYYRYNADDAPINFDLNNDEIYDYVLEREALKEIYNVSPRCIKNLGKPSEHFGNLNKRGGGMDLMQNILVIILVIVMLYLIYIFLCEDTKSEINPGRYIARLDY